MLKFFRKNRFYIPNSFFVQYVEWMLIVLVGLNLCRDIRRGLDPVKQV